MKLNALAAAVILAWATAAQAQTSPSNPPTTEEGKPTEPPKPPPPPQFKFELHGFVSASLFVQDANLGVSSGQHTLFVPAQTNTVRAPNTDKLVTGGDVRQSRFNFSISGPQVFGGATPKGVLELDWFGGFGSGINGDVSLVPRLRLAYAELNWGLNRLQFGQNLDLSFAMAPVSLSHIAQPLGFGTGNFGWRRPGIFGYHTFGDPKASRVEFAWEVGRAQWNDNGGIGANASVVGGDKYGFQAGEASGLPAVQARLTVSMDTTFSGFVVGHWNRVDRSGADANETTTPAGISSTLDVIAGGAGFRAVAGPLTLSSCGYIGKNMTPLVGAILQQIQPNTVGDVHEWGAWGQAGFNLTKELSAWAFIGTQKPKFEDARAAGYTRIQNTTSAGMLQYREGGYAIGVEYLHFLTKTRVPATGGANPTPDLSANLTGNEVLLTANYFF